MQEEEILKLIKNLKEGSEEIWKTSALKLVSLGKIAIPFLLEAIRKGDYNSERWNTVGIEFIRKKKFEEAEKIFRALLEKEKEKNEGRNLNNLGISYLGQGKFEEALDAFQKAFEFDIKNVGRKKAMTLPAWFNLLSLYQRGRKRPDRIDVDKNGRAKMSPIWEVIYTEIVAGGFIAGSLFYLLMFLGEQIGHWGGFLIAFLILIICVIILYKFKDRL